MLEFDLDPDEEVAIDDEGLAEPDEVPVDELESVLAEDGEELVEVEPVVPDLVPNPKRGQSLASPSLV